MQSWQIKVYIYRDSRDSLQKIVIVLVVTVTKGVGGFRSMFEVCFCYTSSHNHGSVKNGCISNSSYLSNIAIFHFHAIMGERVKGSLVGGFNPFEKY